METLPQDPRVVVIGTSSAGKSTFARVLARGLRVPYVELDELHWAPHWEERPDADFARLVANATSGSLWVADGNYGVVRDVLWPRANVIVWLNYSFAVIFWRGLRRTIERSVSKQVLWHGNRESLRKALFSKDSILLWILTTYKRRRLEFAHLKQSAKYAHLRWVEFRKPSEAARWLSVFGVPRDA
jgi:adenylate kinase family enzyme